jgi:hypothetical protein
VAAGVTFAPTQTVEPVSFRGFHWRCQLPGIIYRLSGIIYSRSKHLANSGLMRPSRSTNDLVRLATSGTVWQLPPTERT